MEEKKELTRRKELDTLYVYDVDFGKKDNSEAVIKDLLVYYVQNAIFYKKLFYILNISAIVLNAAIPIVNQTKWVDTKLMTTVISTLAAVIISLLALANVKDSWIRYRNYAEKLKSECNKVNAGIGAYNTTDLTKKKKRFFEALENISTEDLALWTKVRSEDVEVNKDSKK